MCRVSSRASGGTLAAFLIIAAIVGFAGGAYLGTQSGDDDPGSSAVADDGADSDGNAGDTGGDPPDADDPETDTEDETENGALTFSLSESAASANSRIDYSGQLDSGESGVEVRLQRSIDGGDWQNFPENSPIVRETGEDGSFSGYLQTQRSGENSFRVVRTDDDSVASEPAVVTIE